LDVEDGWILGNFATLLFQHRYSNVDQPTHDLTLDIENLYWRALSADPDNLMWKVNLGGFLLACGRTREGLDLFDQQVIPRLSEEDNDSTLRMETWFYVLCHARARRDEAIHHLRTCLAGGARSHGWNFSVHVERARHEGDGEVIWLERLAQVISHDTPMTILDMWPLWNPTAQESYFSHGQEEAGITYNPSPRKSDGTIQYARRKKPPAQCGEEALPSSLPFSSARSSTQEEGVGGEARQGLRLKLRPREPVADDFTLTAESMASMTGDHTSHPNSFDTSSDARFWSSSDEEDPENAFDLSTKAGDSPSKEEEDLLPEEVKGQQIGKPVRKKQPPRGTTRGGKQPSRNGSDLGVSKKRTATRKPGRPVLGSQPGDEDEYAPTSASPSIKRKRGPPTTPPTNKRNAKKGRPQQEQPSSGRGRSKLKPSPSRRRFTKLEEEKAAIEERRLRWSNPFELMADEFDPDCVLKDAETREESREEDPFDFDNHLRRKEKVLRREQDELLTFLGKHRPATASATSPPPLDKDGSAFDFDEEDG